MKDIQQQQDKEKTTKGNQVLKKPAAAKRKAKAKAKSKNAPTDESQVEEEHDETNKAEDVEEGKDHEKEEGVEGQPKAKGKGKAKAKAKAKAQGGRTRKNKGEETAVQEPERRYRLDENGERLFDEDIPTPKKRLFQETGAEGNGEETKKAKHLERIREELLPKPIRQAKQEAARQIEEPTAETKGKGRGRGRGRGRGAKTPVTSPTKVSSPSIKKEKTRRQRKSKDPVENEDVATLDDKLMRGLVLQTLKPVDVLNYDDLKQHLRTNIPDTANQHGDLSVYWNRMACGVRWLDDAAKPQVAYFAFKHPKVKSYNLLMTAAFSAGSLMVPLPINSWSGFLFQILASNLSRST